MILSLAHLAYLQIRNMISHYGIGILEINITYMIQLCKFTQIAFNYEDGGKDEKEIKYSYHREK